MTLAQYGIWSLTADVPDQLLKNVLFTRELADSEEEFEKDIIIKDAIIQMEDNSEKVNKNSLELWPYEIEFYKGKCVVMFQI